MPHTFLVIWRESNRLKKKKPKQPNKTTHIHGTNIIVGKK